MAFVDGLLKLLGTNRTRVAWKLRAWRRAWERRAGAAKNRARALGYAHQACPRCSHPADAAARTCSRCGEPLGGRLAHRARRLGGMLWIDGAPVVATVMIAALAALYVTTLVWGSRAGLTDGFTTTPHALAFARFGSLHTIAVEHGEWWRLSTSTFLHVNVLHLVMNVLSLYGAARYLEEVLGIAKTLALYLGLGLVASATSFVWHSQTWPYVGDAAGASGAICGLIGVAVGFSFRRRNVQRHLFGHYAMWSAWLVVLVFSPWPIDHAGHFGGFVPGVLVGLLVRRRGDTGARARRAWSYGALVLVALALAACVLAAGRQVPDDVLEQARALSHASRPVAD